MVCSRSSFVTHFAMLLLLAAVIASQSGTSVAQEQRDVWPGTEWLRATPQQQGLDPGPLESLADDVAAGRYGFVDRLFVVRNGFAVLDRRYRHDYVEASRDRDLEPHQYNYFHPDWHPFYRGSELHTLQSITKSVTSALIGIALDRGDIAGTQVRVLPVFRSYEPMELDDRKRAIRLIDLLTMRSGIEWHETDRPFGPTNTTIQLEESDDWIGFTLDQPMDSEPGSKWVYNSGASQLLSGMIKEAIGVHTHQFAEVNLFEPIGISEYHWKITPTGHADTEGGLYLKAEDLARFGYLFLRNGEWDGRRIISREWVRMSTARIVDDVAPASRDDRGYGFQWWRLERDETAIWAGLGYGGQYLIVMPQRDIVAVVNSWNIFEPRPSVLGPLIEALGAVER